MNQRLSRNNKKGNNLNFVSIGTGGDVTRHVPNEPVQVQVPQKATGDIKPEPAPKPVEVAKPQAGTAKASPNFKPITPPEQQVSKEEEQKAIANNSTPAEDKKPE